MNKILSKIINPHNIIAGLDIGNSSVKFMEIQGDNLENAHMVNYIIEPIPREYFNNETGLIENMKGIAEIIRSCWKKSKSNTKNVAITLSSSGVISKKAIIPKIENENDLKSQIESEIANYFPEMKLEDVTLDYYIVQENPDNSEENDMILVAAKKDKIDERIALVEMAGLIPIIIDVEQYALQNLLRLMKGEDFNRKTIMLLDCSAKVMKMFVFKNGVLMHTKDVEIGGDNFTEEIMNNMNIKNVQEAERLKLIKSGDETFNMIEKTFLMNYAAEFLREFQYFINFNTISDIDEVILCGGVAGMEGIEEAFANTILEHGEKNIKNAPYVARPLENISKENNISLSKFLNDEPSLFLVTSLALRHFLRQY